MVNVTNVEGQKFDMSLIEFLILCLEVKYPELKNKKGVSQEVKRKFESINLTLMQTIANVSMNESGVVCGVFFTDYGAGYIDCLASMTDIEKMLNNPLLS